MIRDGTVCIHNECDPPRRSKRKSLGKGCLYCSVCSHTHCHPIVCSGIEELRRNGGAQRTLQGLGLLCSCLFTFQLGSKASYKCSLFYIYRDGIKQRGIAVLCLVSLTQKSYCRPTEGAMVLSPTVRSYV